MVATRDVAMLQPDRCAHVHPAGVLLWCDACARGHAGAAPPPRYRCGDLVRVEPHQRTADTDKHDLDRFGVVDQVMVAIHGAYMSTVRAPNARPSWRETITVRTIPSTKERKQIILWCGTADDVAPYVLADDDPPDIAPRLSELQALVIASPIRSI